MRAGMLPIFAALSILLLTASAVAAQAQDTELGGLIYENDMETFAEGSGVVSDAITLDGDVEVTGTLSSTGQIEAGADGIAFADGSIQLTAGGGSPSQSANSGIYDNRIPDFVPPLAFTEVCFKNGQILSDIHTVSEGPAGGQCEAGDLGWIIERDERTAANWVVARAECLVEGMRLPEPFEWQLSCFNLMQWGLNSMTNGREWASNTTIVWNNGSAGGVVVSTLGEGTCNYGNVGFVGRNTGSIGLYPFRCVL